MRDLYLSKFSGVLWLAQRLQTSFYSRRFEGVYDKIHSHNASRCPFVFCSSSLEQLCFSQQLCALGSKRRFFSVMAASSLHRVSAEGFSTALPAHSFFSSAAPQCHRRSIPRCAVVFDFSTPFLSSPVTKLGNHSRAVAPSDWVSLFLELGRKTAHEGANLPQNFTEENEKHLPSTSFPLMGQLKELQANTVVQHAVFLYQSAQFRSEILWEYEGLLPRHDRGYRITAGDRTCERARMRYAPSGLIERAHHLLLTTLHHGYELQEDVTCNPQWSHHHYLHSSCTCGAFSGTYFACRANIALIIGLLGEALFEESFFSSQLNKKRSMKPPCRVFKPSMISSTDAWRLENIALVTLLLRNPHSASCTSPYNISGEGQLSQNETASDQLSQSAEVGPYFRSPSCDALSLYFEHMRSFPLPLSLAMNLVVLPWQTMDRLRILLRRAIHDFWGVKGAASWSPQKRGAAAAHLFTSLVNALLSNDLFFSASSGHDMKQDNGLAKSASLSSSFSELHQLLCSELLSAVPSWYEAKINSCVNGSAGASTRTNTNEVPSSFTRLTPLSSFLYSFSRHLRWTPLLHKLCRVYTKAGRGLDLLECHHRLLQAIPEAEAHWPRSYYIRLMGALLDEGKRLPTEETEEERYRTASYFAGVYTHTSKSDPIAVRSWRSIAEVGKRAVSIFQSSTQDARSLWVVLCKAALTMHPVFFSCERLLEAYRLMVTDESDDSVLDYPLRGERATRVWEVDIGGLQQIVRLVRSAMVCTPSMFAASTGLLEEKEKLLMLLRAYKSHILNLLDDFLQLYRFTSARGTNGLNSGANQASGSTTLSYSSWWVEQVGFVMLDLKSVMEAVSPVSLSKGSNDSWSLLETHVEHEAVEKLTRTIAELARQIPVRGEKSVGTREGLQVLQKHAQWSPVLEWLNLLPISDTQSSEMLEISSIRQTDNLLPSQRESLYLSSSSSPRYCYDSPFWSCGCGKENTLSDICCSFCTPLGSTAHCFTCPTCYEKVSHPLVYQSVVRGHASESSEVFTMDAHLCPYCFTSHPRDQRLAYALLHKNALSNPCEDLVEGNTVNCKDADRHCLLCGSLVPPTSMVQLKEILEDANPSLPSVFFFHCGVYQCVDEHRPFFCPCQCSPTKKSSLASLPGALSENSNNATCGEWQASYHCAFCFSPRPEICASHTEDGTFYCWQCTRECELGTSEMEESTPLWLGSAVLPVEEQSNFGSRSDLRCGQWNYSWMKECVRCGKPRLHSIRVPRARGHIVHRMITSHNRPPTGTSLNRGEEVLLGTDAFCSQCGLPHVSDQCPVCLDMV